MEERLFLPNLDYWRYGNKWTGSLGRASFFIDPSDEHFSVEMWTGPLCHALCTVEQRAEFPLEEEGLQALRAWLLEEAEKINAANPGPFEYEW